MAPQRGIAAGMTRASGKRYRTVWAGSTGSLAVLIPLVRRVAPEQPDPVFSAWQGMAYTYDMFSGRAQLLSLENDRYPELRWTSLLDRFTGA